MTRSSVMAEGIVKLQCSPVLQQQQQQQQQEQHHLGIILPITSRGMKSPMVNLHSYLRQISGNLKLPSGSNLYIAVDNDDAVYSRDSSAYLFKEAFCEQKVTVVTEWPAAHAAHAASSVEDSVAAAAGAESVAPICAMLNILIKRAYEDGCDFFTMLGDDVCIDCEQQSSDNQRRNWFDLVVDRFAQISSLNSLPFGFGCVALNDTSSPGFPTFPIVHRLHVEAMGVAFCPSEFVNQDADPFVYELYRGWNASSLLLEVRLTNAIGGARGEPRYKRQHIDWKNTVLKSAINALQSTYIHLLPPPTMLCIDVVIPTYRVNVQALRKILSIEQPATVSTLFIIVIDDPSATEAADEVKKFESEYTGRVRVRCMPKNTGASAARNRGIEESAADWILFLDDDVEPEVDILHHYAHSIKTHGSRTCGFVGLTSFPRSDSAKIANAAYLSHILYFWSISERFPEQAVGWGVTANLLMRRTDVRFRTDFPKTGGGEDVAFCLDCQERCSLPLWSAVNARAAHPWWDNGRFQVVRFFKWAKGDGLLLDIYPQFTYRALPNVNELTLLWVLLIALICCNSHSQTILPLKPALAILIWIWVVDIVADLYSLLIGPDCSSYPHITGFKTRFTGALASTILKAAVEFGHLWIQVRRLKIHNLCKRFDWFVNLSPNEKRKQQMRSCIRFTGYIMPILAHLFTLIVIDNTSHSDL